MAAPGTNWRVCRPDGDDADVYYFDIETGETSWEVPPGVDVAHIPEFGVEDEVFDPTNPDPASLHGSDSEEAGEGSDGDPSDGPETSGSRPNGGAGGAGAGTGSGHDRTAEAAAAEEAAALRRQRAKERAARRRKARGWVVPEGTEPSYVDVGNVWEKRVDEASGDVYFFNLVSGETEWEEPDDYEDPDELDFDPDAPIAETLADMYLCAGDGAEAQAERDAMLRGGTDAGPVHRRLRSLLQLFQGCGTEQEWVAALSNDEEWLPRFVHSCWSPVTPPKTGLIVAQLLVLFANLEPSVGTHMVDGTWGELGRSVAGAMAGLRTAIHKESDDDQAKRLSTWLLVLQCLFSAAARGDDMPTIHALGGLELCELLIDVLGDAEEDVRLCVAVTAGKMHYLCAAAAAAAPEDKPQANPWLQACTEHDRARQLGQTVVVLQNNLGYPYVDETSVIGTLRFIRDLFAIKRPGAGGDDHTHFFYTNDLKVLVDVLLRAIADLPPPNKVRAEFIKVLGALMVRTQWATDCELYRSGDIATALEGLTDEDVAADDLDPGAAAAAAYVLDLCSELLD